jgi:hypothetical protein
VSGETTWYPVGKIPQWADVIFSGDLICEQYNNHAQLHEGFWNSVFGQTGCRKVTEYDGGDDDYLADYGYVAKDRDIWIYTGVTSLNNDSSNIGFIMSNERTEETIFITCAGADEFSAMAAAQGEVQEKGYVASFPSLINVEGQATYIMVLKDENGLVKLYALVNVENYSIVATGDSQASAKQAYLEELAKRGVITEEELPAPETKTAEITVTAVRLATVGGETVVYLTAEDGTVYRGALASDESLILVTEGMALTVEYAETEHEKIRAIVSWSEKAE